MKKDNFVGQRIFLSGIINFFKNKLISQKITYLVYFYKIDSVKGQIYDARWKNYFRFEKI